MTPPLCYANPSCPSTTNPITVSIVMLLLKPFMSNTYIQNSNLSCNVRHVNVS